MTTHGTNFCNFKPATCSAEFVGANQVSLRKWAFNSIGIGGTGRATLLGPYGQMVEYLRMNIIAVPVTR